MRDETSVGVVVLEGAGGKTFCAGGDLDIFPSLAEHQSAMNWLAHSGLDVQRAIVNCEKVVIGKLNGNCLADNLSTGCQIMLLNLLHYRCINFKK